MKKLMNRIKKIALVIAAVFVVVFVGLWIYSMDSYKPLDAIYESIEQMDKSYIRTEVIDEITFTVDFPIKQVLSIPGGTVGSIISNSNHLVSYVVFLASYPIFDVIDKETLNLTVENDLILDASKIEENKGILNESCQYSSIAGGNHAQFG